jgi:hypothetical protein
MVSLSASVRNGEGIFADLGNNEVPVITREISFQPNCRYILECMHFEEKTLNIISAES